LYRRNTRNILGTSPKRLKGFTPMMNWTKRLIFTTSFLALITSNVLTLTHTAFNTALSGFMSSALGVRTVSGAMQSKLSRQGKTIKSQKATQARRTAATRKFGSRLASRTKRVAAKSIAAIPAESIPFIGVAVIIADTSYELYAACETVRDLDQLYADLNITAEEPDSAIQSVCDPELPDPGGVWDDVVEQSGQWWGMLSEAV